MLILLINRQGAQGNLDTASHSTLDNEFGTHAEEEVIKQIIEKGTIQEGDVRNHFISSETSIFLCQIADMFLTVRRTNGPKERQHGRPRWSLSALLLNLSSLGP
jgi:ribosome maturation protein Sdo1